jgi:hypothetical protein
MRRAMRPSAALFDYMRQNLKLDFTDLTFENFTHVNVLKRVSPPA